jgi:tRNA(Ile)-lysidine synthase TilS/MesJ
VSRADILAFLSQRGLTFRRDASNGDRRLLRTRVRQDVAALSAEERGRLAAEVARLRALREDIERELAERILPRVRFAADEASVDAALLSGASEEIVRAALERLAASFARPGRPPMTGREREQILRRLSSGADFRFEAGRRIRFERRRGILAVRPVYHSRIERSAQVQAGRGVTR